MRDGRASTPSSPAAHAAAPADARRPRPAPAAGPPVLAFAARRAGVAPAGRWRERLALLAAATGWACAGFRCDPTLDGRRLCAGLPPARARRADRPAVRGGAEHAGRRSQRRGVPARAARRAVQRPGFGRPAAAAACRSANCFRSRPLRWLHGARRRRAAWARGSANWRRDRHGWRVDGAAFDRVVLACRAAEAARLARRRRAAWARHAPRPCATSPSSPSTCAAAGTRLPAPMLALPAGAEAPGAVRLRPRRSSAAPRGLLAFVVSGARPWVDAGARPRSRRRCAQAAARSGTCCGAPRGRSAHRPKSAPPSAARPACSGRRLPIAPGLLAAGDYVAGPLPGHAGRRRAQRPCSAAAAAAIDASA